MDNLLSTAENTTSKKEAQEFQKTVETSETPRIGNKSIKEEMK